MPPGACSAVGALVAAASLVAAVGQAAVPPGDFNSSSVVRLDASQGFAEAHASDPLLSEFEKFVATFAKTYTSTEWETRFAAFKENILLIRSHNAKNSSFMLDLNEHADLTSREFARARNGLKAPLARAWGDMPQMQATATRDEPLPDHVDWVALGTLPPVLNQGSCGGCWSFAATAALSAAWKIATGRLDALSQQQLLDCSVPFGNQGCEGGNMDNAFMYARGAALCAAATYPYVGAVGTCRKGCQAIIPQGGVSGYRLVPESNERALLEAVAEQPVAVGIEAEEEPAFQLYSHGVMSGLCGTKPNHAVLVVGYGTRGGKPYWLIRNSWGRTWGEDGYFKLVRGEGPAGVGECGILSMPSYPTVDGSIDSPQTPGGPSSAPVEDLSVYGEPPCPRGEHAASLPAASGRAGGRLCTPECTVDGRCPAPGKCVLRERGAWEARRFCAILCAGDAACPSGASCSHSGSDAAAGICLFPMAPAGGAWPLLLALGSATDEAPARGGPGAGRKLSEGAGWDILV